MPETQALRNKILEHLEEKEITQRHLALLINVNPQYLSEVLNGKKTGPKANEMLLTIVKVLGIK
ncbi:helix-turn-helix domain-containing protein [Jeotgalibaca dankookensis]|uniref:helix-turn-helix domain-containing protein n=1 Tax=Jeotgalibaca dankookensis TaxID=708126 RepID=UPI0007805A25|nr:helix-turn-helix transcriptional regulator [Jeotgalibaca dankookensis]